MKFYYVYQNKTYEAEKNGGFLWSPQKNKSGGRNAGYETMAIVKKDDIIIHSYDAKIVAISKAKTDCYSAPRPGADFTEWDYNGYRVDTEYYELHSPINTLDHISALYSIQPATNGPYTITLRGRQQYLCSANQDIFDYILSACTTSDKNAIVAKFTHRTFKISETAKRTNQDLDLGLNEDVSESSSLPTTFEYKAEVKLKSSDYIVNQGHKIYKRDKQTSVNALAHANYKCEVDGTHATFMRRKGNVPYTEPHHLIPMSYSDYFDYSLDVEENIVSLCSNCHNQLHYGADFEPLLRQLYNLRKDLLETVGLKISFEELLEMYK